MRYSMQNSFIRTQLNAWEVSLITIHLDENEEITSLNFQNLDALNIPLIVQRIEFLKG